MKAITCKQASCMQSNIFSKYQNLGKQQACGVFATQGVVGDDYNPRRLRAVVENINACHSVEGLCRELPQRALALHAAQGLDK